MVESAKDLPSGLLTSDVRERPEPIHSFGNRGVGFIAAGSSVRFVRQVPERAERLS